MIIPETKTTIHTALNIGLFFGAGAEIDYGLPSGGRFALEIFRGTAETEKRLFRKLIDSIDITSPYANDWLPPNYKSKRVSAFGKPEFLTLIESSIEYRKSDIISFFNNFDQHVKSRLSKWQLSESQVREAFLRDTTKQIGEVRYGQSIELNEALRAKTNLFDSDFFSAMLEATKHDPENKQLRTPLGATLQLLVGSFGQDLVQALNQEIFKKAPDDIPVFDDVAGVFRIEFARAGLAALELILEGTRRTLTADSDISTILGELMSSVLEDLFSDALDYQSLIDSHYRYLYRPQAEWTKFCKIAIFLHTARNYIIREAKKCIETINAGDGYYHDILSTGDLRMSIPVIGTTNYNNLIEHVVSSSRVIHLNGSVSDFYDPYSNTVRAVPDDDIENQNRLLVPFIFTQSGIKPLTSVEMSRKYVDLFDSFKSSDAVVVVGFGFNGDDGHVNGLFRELIDEHKKNVIIVCPNTGKDSSELKKDYRRKLRSSSVETLHILQIDTKTRKTKEGTHWLEAISELRSRFVS